MRLCVREKSGGFFFLYSEHLLVDNFRQKVSSYVSLRIYGGYFSTDFFFNFLADNSANKYTIKQLAVLSYFVADFSANNLLKVKSANK
jgi:hypothetical protein